VALNNFKIMQHIIFLAVFIPDLSRKINMKNMKSLRFLTIIAILGITACVNGQMRKTVWGDKHVVSKERKTESFTGIKVSTGIDVYLKQGDDESLTVEADENLHEYIITEVRNGILDVYSDANIRDAERKRVYERD
jgi:uncharacterized protein YxeA